ncbi:MAG: c-type cytochrome [Anaerolineales bacterium]|nr:c-type cytochrome [Anaerolineales bacterium]
MSRFFFWILACFALIGLIAAWIFSRLPVTIHARVAEDGGFMPDNIKVRAGEPLKLRLIADDVEHTFAIGQNPMQLVLLKPGEPIYLTLTFDKPGTYTFYTTTPSSLNFWRMRGTIEVAGNGEMQAAESPLYVRLGLELDSEHEEGEQHFWLPHQPSASRGEAFAGQIPAMALTRDYYVAHSPMETFEELRAESALQSLRDEQLWDAVAYIWMQNSSSIALLDGRRLYQVNCAACHGENGAGDGQFADEMKAIAEQNQDEHGIQPPTDFTDAEHLLEAKPAILQGLTLRGGMGTGMPMWGTIFTDEQTWDLVAYLYSFQFEYQGVNQ